MASILTTLFYMAVILAVISLILPARFYEARKRSRKQSFLIWLALALFFFIGISFFAPPVPPDTKTPAPETSESLEPESASLPEASTPEEIPAEASEAPVLETPAPKTPEAPEIVTPEPQETKPAPAPEPTRHRGVTQQDLVDEPVDSDGEEVTDGENGGIRGTIEMPQEDAIPVYPGK